MRAALQQINPNLMITRFQSFAQQVDLGFSQQQMIVQLTSLFGLVALALAAIGLYGVTAYAVAQRTSEIGIRMALGANHGHVQKMVLRDAFLQVGLGLVIGIPAALAAGHLMAAELFGVRVEPARPGNDDSGAGRRGPARGGAAARRAAGVEPMEALRGRDMRGRAQNIRRTALRRTSPRFQQREAQGTHPTKSWKYCRQPFAYRIREGLPVIREHCSESLV